MRDKITLKKIEIGTKVLFLVSLLPILYCSFFDYANGDDLWEGAAARQVIVNGGSFKELVQAVWQWAKVDYIGWEGNWSSIILWCLEPSIWGEKVYCITPWIALLFLCGGICYFLNHYLRKLFGGAAEFSKIISILVCFICVQYMPNIRCGIFWYTGMVNYIVPFGLGLTVFVWADKFIESKKICWLVPISIALAYMGGAGYPPIILVFEILFVMIIISVLKDRQKHAPLLLIPIMLLLAGFYFSAVSPGNAVRGGEEYYFSYTRIVETIFMSLVQGGKEIATIFWRARPLILAVPVIAVITWEAIDVKTSDYKYPILVSIFLYLIYCSMYTPQIYARSEVSGGVPDVIFYVFVITFTIDIVYLSCWAKKKVFERKEIEGTTIRNIRTGVIGTVIIVSILGGRFLIGSMTDYTCIKFIRSGQLRDFEYQMQERIAILNGTEQNVILPEMNDEQGPFMHMPVIDKPQAYTNRATARFYGKESVIAIPREEYYRQYGHPLLDE